MPLGQHRGQTKVVCKQLNRELCKSQAYAHAIRGFAWNFDPFSRLGDSVHPGEEWTGQMLAPTPRERTC